MCIGAMQRADALYEFCPVDVRIMPAGADPAAKFGFELAALGPRNVSAVIAFDTTGGWFTAAVPQAVIAEKDRHYKGPSSEFIMRDWVSPVMYVQFPKPVNILHRWILSAQASGDQFGWAAQGNVLCEPYTDGNGIQLPSGGRLPFTTTDGDEVPKGSASSVPVIAAQSSQALKSGSCAKPFTQAAPLHLVQPKDLTPPRVPLTTVIEAAVKPDGTLADTWVWGPSGDQVFDASRLDEVKRDTFKAGSAYCEPAAGFYFLTFAFAPR
jgi:hypothetical protein